MMNLLDRLYDRLEVFRLEQRYMRRRNRDTPKAQYVDGEYIYAPTASYSAKCSGGSSDSEAAVDSTKEGSENKSKLGRRLSKMGLDKADWKKTKEDKRRSRAAVRDVRWDWDEREERT
jgi:hypothetical protein